MKHKQRWVKKVYRLLCKSQGAPENPKHEKNLRQWARLLAGEDSAYFREGMTPQEAHDEEMSCA